MKKNEIFEDELSEWSVADIKNKVIGAFGLKDKAAEKDAQDKAQRYVDILIPLWKKFRTGESSAITSDQVAQFLYSEGFSKQTINIACQKLGWGKPRYTKAKPSEEQPAPPEASNSNTEIPGKKPQLRVVK